MTFRPPREGTRNRAVFDLLVERFNVGNAAYWSELKSAYDNASPAYPQKPGIWMPGMGPRQNPRDYSGMEVSRQLKRFANRIARGVYTLKPEIALEYLKPAEKPKDVVVPRAVMESIFNTLTELTYNSDPDKSRTVSELAATLEMNFSALATVTSIIEDITFRE